MAALILAGFGNAFLFAQTAAEYEVKAAFLYKFAGFVEWPSPSASSPLCIGVLGQDPFGATLEEAVKGKSIGGRGFIVRRFKSGQGPPQCQILFISSSEKRNLRSILNGLEGGPVLTVGDMPGFCESGGIVNLELAQNRVQIRINREAAEKAGLHLSSKLLNLAIIVRGHRQ